MNEIQELEEIESTFGPGLDNFMVAWSQDIKIYLQAIAKTLYFSMPFYTMNTFKWVKAALVDAPCRVMLDIDIEYISIKRKMWLEKNKPDLSKTNNEEKTDKED